MRVLLADGRAEIRSALRLLLEQAAGLTVVGEAADVSEILGQSRRVVPDLVLIDWELPGLDRRQGKTGQDARWLLAIMRSRCPGTLIVALSGRPEARRAAHQAGADAFVSKSLPAEHLLEPSTISTATAR